MANGGRRKRDDILLLGGAVVLAGGVIFFWDRIFPPAYGARQVQVQLSSGEVAQGTSVGVTGTFLGDGDVPVTVPEAHMRVKTPLGTEVPGTHVIRNNVSIISESIQTGSMPPGEYVVEVADNPSFT